VLTSYLAANAIAVPATAWLTGLLGRRRLFLLCATVFTASSFLSGLAPNLEFLVIMRVIQGLGGGPIIPMAQATMWEIFPLRQRGLAMAVWGMGIMMAPILGPTLGGWICDNWSWRWIFYVNLPIGAVALFMVATRLRERIVRRPHKIDVAGSALVFAGIGLLVFGLLEGGVHWAWGSVQSLLVFGAAALALAAFVYQERRASEPTVPGWVFARRVPLGSALGNAVIGVLLIGMTTFLPTYVQGVHGASTLVAGFTLTAMSLGWSVSSTFSSRLYLRIGFRDAALIGMILATVAAFTLGLLPGSSPLWAVAAASLLLGAGIGLPSTSLMVGMQSVVGWERRGVATGASMFTRMLGSAIGAAALGGVANSTLAGWFRAAPDSLRGRLPSVNAVSQAIGGGAGRAQDAVAEYVRGGLDLASHRVFHALAVIAILGVGAVLVAPRRFRTLRFDREAGEPSDQSRHAA